MFGDALRFLSTDTPWHSKNAPPQAPKFAQWLPKRRWVQPKWRQKAQKVWQRPPKTIAEAIIFQKTMNSWCAQKTRGIIGSNTLAPVRFAPESTQRAPLLSKMQPR